MKTKTKNTKDLCEGINGSGETVWTVFVMQGKRVLGMHRFDNQAEALCWMKWA